MEIITIRINKTVSVTTELEGEIEVIGKGGQKIKLEIPDEILVVFIDQSADLIHSKMRDLVNDLRS